MQVTAFTSRTVDVADSTISDGARSKACSYRSESNRGFTVRPTENAARSPENSPIQLVPELVLFILVVSAGRFLAFRVEAKLQIGMILCLGLFALFRVNKAQTAVANSKNNLSALGILAIALLTFRDESYTQLATFFAAFITLYIISRVATRAAAYQSLIAGLSLYVIANIFGWLIGIKSPYSAYRLSGYETSSPFFGERITFPFSVSINETPYVAAALLLAILAMARTGERLHWHHWIGLFGGIFTLLAANNRTTVLLVFTLSFLIFAAPNIMRVSSPYLLSIALLLPLFISLARPALNFIAETLQDNFFLGRGGTLVSLGTLEGRTEIWDAFISFWSDQYARGLSEGSSILFGYGSPGHTISGAYLYVPKAHSEFLRERTALHAHNSALQISLDAGLIGTALLLAVTIHLAYRYSRNPNLLPVFIVLVTFVLSGVLESSLAPGMKYLAIYVLIYLAFFEPSRTQSSEHTKLGARLPGRFLNQRPGPEPGN